VGLQCAILADNFRFFFLTTVFESSVGYEKLPMTYDGLLVTFVEPVGYVLNVSPLDTLTLPCLFLLLSVLATCMIYCFG